MSKAGPRISFEDFPPKTDAGKEKLLNETTPALDALNPEFFSVTYGAGGSTREMTHDLVLRIKSEAQITTVPHLTCVCHQQDEIHDILTRYAESGVGNILALGGDLPGNRPDYDR